MRSKSIVLLIMLLLIVGASEAFAVQTITATPSQVPKGAYVNGPDGNTDDNYYFQMLYYKYGTNANAGADAMQFTLPTGMYVADVDNDMTITDEIAITWVVSGGSTFAFGTSTTIDTNNVIYIDITNPPKADDEVWIMFPVTTDASPSVSTDDYYSTVAGEAAIADGSGAFITYRDAGALQLVAFENNLSGDDDMTTTYGEKFPATAANLFAALPDFVKDLGVGVASVHVDPTIGTDATDITYTIWVAPDSTLNHLEVKASGAQRAIEFTSETFFNVYEGGTGSTGQINTTFLNEGEWWVYISSNLTGDFPLARSGMLLIRHWPVVRYMGWDQDQVGSFDTEGPAYDDDADITLDTGSYIDIDGSAAGTSTKKTDVNLYIKVDDYDHKAEVIIYYSTESALTLSDLVTSGPDEAKVVDSFGDPAKTIVIVDTLVENEEDVQGFILFNWSVLPDSLTGAYIDAGSYTLYAVANDGRHQDVLKAQGANNTGGLTVVIAHSPYLKLDSLNEYDSDGATGVQINLGSKDVVMLSWGKSGVDGDKDIDNSCLISLYLYPDQGTDGFADFGAADADLLTADSKAVLIASNIEEDYDSKTLSWYAWDIQEFKAQNPTWSPTLAQEYHVYAVIDENVVDGTKRLVALDPGDVGGILETTDSPDKIFFVNDPFVRAYDPPADGVTVNGAETYRIRFQSFDVDNDAKVGIFIVSATTTSGEAHGAPLTTTVPWLVVASNGEPGSSYCLTDNDGNSTNDSNAGEWLSEDSQSYYDLTIRKPSDTGTIRYLQDMGGTVINLPDDTYWVYIGIDQVGDEFGSGQTLYRAPGQLVIENVAVDAIQQNLMMLPAKISAAEGDTITFSINACDAGNLNITLMDFWLAIDQNYFTLVNPSEPFTDRVPGIGSLLPQSIEDDADNQRWILNATAWNSNNQIDTADADAGSAVATFQVIAKGTINPIEVSNAVGFMTGQGQTRFLDQGVNILPLNIANTVVSMQPRSLIKGNVELEGEERTIHDVTVTFELRKRGSYEPYYDASFYTENDADSDTPGIQYQVSGAGLFELFRVPPGEWDLVTYYNRYIPELKAVSVYAGLDTLNIDFGILIGGDCVGYVDSSGVTWPNNRIEAEDLDQISRAYHATAATQSENWNAPANWRWADIDETGTVDIADLTIASTNYTGINIDSAQPIFAGKAAIPKSASNLEAVVELMDVPSALEAGESYTILAVVTNSADVKGYFVNLDYDADVFQFEGVLNGGFVDTQSYYFPTLNDGAVGFSNAVIGPENFTGDGILAEFTFTALEDAAVTSDMLRIAEATLVNSTFKKDTVVMLNFTSVEADLPVEFALNQNYPNPFNPLTTISFAIPEQGNMNLKVYDILGRHVTTLASGSYAPGNYSIIWDATDDSGNIVSAGLYFYRIQAGKFRATKRMMLLK